MFTLRLLRRTKPIQRARLISHYPTLKDAKPTNTISNAEESIPKAASSNPSVMGPMTVTPRNFDKKVLVWMKYYKSTDEVPDRVSYETLDKAQNWFRIRISNCLMGLTLLGIVGVVIYGKKRAERGESIHQMNMDWHDKINVEDRTDLAKEEANKKQ